MLKRRPIELTKVIECKLHLMRAETVKRRAVNHLVPTRDV